MNKDREYRSFELIQREKTEEPDYIAEGYASTFERYLMFKDGDTEYYEQIDPHAFDEADMSDCVFRIDHEGRVYARTSAGTVKLDVDDHGLHSEIDLSRTAAAREVHDDIMAGNYPQMSFAFTIEKDSYDRATHTRIIDRIAKVYDIAAVTWPANPTTELSVRSAEFFNGEIEKEKAERLEAERRKSALERINNSLKKEDPDNDN